MSAPAHGETHFEFTVQKTFEQPRRLDAYVVSRLPDLSRVEVQRLILSGALTVQGGKAKASQKVRPGDQIVLDLPLEMTSRPQPEEIPLEILYEDEFLVVLNKQANLIVHPGRGKENWHGTLTNALQFHFERLSTIGGAARPGIVHRLDRDTTGIIVVAKDDLAHKNLALQFEHRHVEKEYLALCHGRFDRDRDLIARRIGPHPKVREKMAIRDDEAIGRSAETMYEVVERFADHTLVRLRPKTGRTHQLRVHLDHIGHPIVADKLYSGRSALRTTDVDPTAEELVLLDRQALHALRLSFRHPRCHERMEFEAPLPADFLRTLSFLRAIPAPSGHLRSVRRPHGD